jgi:hypothetical protein
MRRRWCPHDKDAGQRDEGDLAIAGADAVGIDLVNAAVVGATATTATGVMPRIVADTIEGAGAVGAPAADQDAQLRAWRDEEVALHGAPDAA